MDKPYYSVDNGFGEEIATGLESYERASYVAQRYLAAHQDGKPFTAWTERRVYFPAMYDGSVWVASAPRNPCDEAHDSAFVGGYVYNRR